MSNQFTKMLDNLHHVNFSMVWKSIAIGTFSAVLVIVFRLILVAAESLNKGIMETATFPMLIVIFVGFLVLGLIIGILARWEPLSSGSGVPQVQAEVLGRVEMNPFKIIAAKFLGGACTALSGLSLGRQGPCIQICGAAGKIVGKLTKANSSEIRMLITAGTSAGLAAAFSAPISGALFALEEVHKKFAHTVMIPAFIAAITADTITKYAFDMRPIFEFAVPYHIPLASHFTLVPLGILTGLISMIYSKSMLGIQLFVQRLSIPKILLPIIATGTAFFVCLTFPAIQNGGESLIEEIALNNFPVLLLLGLLFGKILFTSFSYNSTAQGGFLLPTLVIGSVTGSLYFHSLRYFDLLPDTLRPNFVLLGMVGVLTGVVQSPIVSVLLVTEMSGTFTNILAPITVAVTSIFVSNSIFYVKPIYETLLERFLSNHIDSDNEPGEEKIMTEFIISESSWFAKRQLKTINWPHNSLVISVQGKTASFVPNGDSLLMPGDKLIILVDKSKLYALTQWLESSDLYPMPLLVREDPPP